MTEAEVTAIVERAVARTLLQLGIDTDDPLSIQADMRALRSWREAGDAVRRHSLLTAVGVFLTGLAGLCWVALTGRGL